MGITLIIVHSCITLLWLHHNHKSSISYHKNGLVSSHQSVGRWFIFCVLFSKNILLKPVGYQQPTRLCVKMEFVAATISPSYELYSLSKAAFVHVGLVQLCTGNGVSFYMCSAVEVAWLAQNVRQSNARV